PSDTPASSAIARIVVPSYPPARNRRSAASTIDWRVASALGDRPGGVVAGSGTGITVVTSLGPQERTDACGRVRCGAGHRGPARPGQPFGQVPVLGGRPQAHHPGQVVVPDRSVVAHDGDLLEGAGVVERREP